jgi:hypothetical protein
MEPATIAALVTAFLSFASDGISRKDRKRQAVLQQRADKEYAQNSVQWRVEDAKKAGIHPLAALGMQPYQNNPMHISDDPTGGIKALGDAFTDAMLQKGVEEAKVREAEAHVANMRHTRAVAESIELENDIKRKQKASFIDGVKVEPLMIPFKDEDGKIIYVPNEKYSGGLDGPLPTALSGWKHLTKGAKTRLKKIETLHEAYQKGSKGMGKNWKEAERKARQKRMRKGKIRRDK